MKKEQIKCSHKAIEWRTYKTIKEKGDGLFPPKKYCQECEIARKLKASKIEII